MLALSWLVLQMLEYHFLKRWYFGELLFLLIASLSTLVGNFYCGYASILAYVCGVAL